MKTRSVIVLVAAVAAVITGLVPARARESADIIIYGGTIHTLAGEPDRPEAVVVTGEEISFIGPREEAERYGGPNTRRIDLAGNTMIPGLVDAHAHLRSLGRYLAQLKLETAESPAHVRQMVLEAQKSLPPGWWLQGRGWDQNDWEVNQFPTWRDLEGTDANPVYFRRIDGHAAWLNKKALEVCGISRDTPDPEGGRIVRDDEGNPTGVLVDNAMELATDVIPDPTPAEIDDWMLAAIRHCNALGLVGIHDAGTDADDLASLERLHQRGELTCNVYCMLSSDADDLEWTEAQIVRGPRELADTRVSVRAVKLYADGALGSRGAALLAPYSDDSDNVGLLVDPPEELERLTRLALQNGFQVCTHAIGDRGNRVILDVYERVLAGTKPERSPRFRIEHAQILSPQDIPRFKKLGVIPAMQPAHCTSDMYWAEERVGRERIKGAYCWRRLIDDGNIIPCGSDFPVEGADPLAGIYAAVTRQDQAGWPEGGWYADQSMTISEAIKGFTIWAAYGAFDELQAGTIAPGHRADFTVLDRDLLTVTPAELLRTRVTMTVVRGEVVYEAE